MEQCCERAYIQIPGGFVDQAVGQGLAVALPARHKAVEQLAKACVHALSATLLPQGRAGWLQLQEDTHTQLYIALAIYSVTRYSAYYGTINNIRRLLILFNNITAIKPLLLLEWTYMYMYYMCTKGEPLI